MLEFQLSALAGFTMLGSVGIWSGLVAHRFAALLLLLGGSVLGFAASEWLLAWACDTQTMRPFAPRMRLARAVAPLACGMLLGIALVWLHQTHAGPPRHDRLEDGPGRPPAQE